MGRDIFFFGSGFSKSLISNYPTLKELSQFIKNKLCYEKDSVQQHFNKEVPSKFHDNIETLLTYLSSNLPYKTEVQISADVALYRDITSKLADHFYSLKNDYPINNDSKIQTFAKYILDRKCTCITLNYDLVLEELLYKNTTQEYQNANKNYSIFYKMPIIDLCNRIPVRHACFASGETDFHRTKMPNIIKLHGSINWLSTGMTNTDLLYSEMENEDNYLKSDLTTFIVPPVLDKQNQYNNIILRTLWKQAFSAIKNARNIYIYGFSFPETDYSIKFLFESALRSNHNFKVYVINTKDSLNEIQSRYCDIFGMSNCDFSCCTDDNQLNVLLNILNCQEVA